MKIKLIIICLLLGGCLSNQDIERRNEAYTNKLYRDCDAGNMDVINYSDGAFIACIAHLLATRSCK